MPGLVKVLLLAGNLVCAFALAYQCGRAWPESRVKGGLTHMFTWLCALMSGACFTWVYGTFLMGAVIVFQWLQPEYLDVMFVLGLWTIYLPLSAISLLILVRLYLYAIARRSILFGAAAVAGTYAYRRAEAFAFEAAGEFGGDVAGAVFDGMLDDVDGDGAVAVIVLIVLGFALTAGYFSTRAIIRSVSQARTQELIAMSYAS